MRDAIPADETEQLRRLFRELPPLLWEATNAIRIDEHDKTLKGDQLVRFRAAEDRVAAVIAHIRHIVDR